MKPFFCPSCENKILHIGADGISSASEDKIMNIDLHKLSSDGVDLWEIDLEGNCPFCDAHIRLAAKSTAVEQQ